jgi:ligand-binding SRPBCC domain-containing protein
MSRRLHRFECRQRLALSLPEAWDFFSRPGNLARITPPDLGFEVTSPLPERMYAGLIVTYRVRPFGNLSVPWVTEITHVRESEFFVDEQRRGPYRFWHHQHHFQAVAGGVAMTDLVHYEIPLGWMGEILCGRMVERRVTAIFAYRREMLAKLIGTLEE